MARMRSMKPEYFDDEELCVGTSRDARLLYPGLWCHADEHGRVRGNPAWIKGKVFPYDDDLGPAEVDKLIDELAALGKVVRYRAGGASYLYLPNLAKHQRLDSEKVPSRLPEPPDPDESGNFPDDPEPDPEPPEQVQARACASLKHVAGSREHVPTTSGAPSAPSAALVLVADEPPDTTQALLGEWLEHCRQRPPGSVIGQVGKQVKAMLGEGIGAREVRVGLAAWHTKGLHPSALPSVVNELMNASPARASPRPATTDQRMAMRDDAVTQAKALTAGGTG